MDGNGFLSLNPAALLDKIHFDSRSVEVLHRDRLSSELQNFECSDSTALGKWLSRTFTTPSASDGTRTSFSLIATSEDEDYDALPFSPSLLERIKLLFNLPAATLSILTTKSNHFQQYIYKASGPERSISGFTMGMTTRGVLLMTFWLSISYDQTTGAVGTILHGFSKDQRAVLKTAIQTQPFMLAHPLFIPVLITMMKHDMIAKEGRRLWLLLMAVETRSGQTGAPAVGTIPGEHLRLLTDSALDNIVRDILGVIQLALGFTTHTKALLQIIHRIRTSAKHVQSVRPETNKERIHDAGVFIDERLELLVEQMQNILADLEFLEKRAQAQFTAIYNYTARRDSQIGQSLASDSSQIARASKRDSSAMTGIAFLTMVFLPGTFVATLPSMPIFDFASSKALSISARHFWLYWAVTIPLTVVVLLTYVGYLFWITRKHDREDLIAKKSNNDDSYGFSFSGVHDRNSRESLELCGS